MQSYLLCSPRQRQMRAAYSACMHKLLSGPLPAPTTESECFSHLPLSRNLNRLPQNRGLALRYSFHNPHSASTHACEVNASSRLQQPRHDAPRLLSPPPYFLPPTNSCAVHFALPSPQQPSPSILSLPRSLALTCCALHPPHASSSIQWPILHLPLPPLPICLPHTLCTLHTRPTVLCTAMLVTTPPPSSPLLLHSPPLPSLPPIYSRAVQCTPHVQPTACSGKCTSLFSSSLLFSTFPCRLI